MRPAVISDPCLFGRASWQPFLACLGGTPPRELPTRVAKAVHSVQPNYDRQLVQVGFITRPSSYTVQHHDQLTISYLQRAGHVEPSNLDLLTPKVQALKDSPDLHPFTRTTTSHITA